MANIANTTATNHKNEEVTVPSWNSIYMMADSGARGSSQQIRQLAAMRGLMAKPSGEIIETPITSNFREGLTVLQYFTSTHGARKGLADTALKTASSGYLTRRLVDVAQDSIVGIDDCDAKDSINITALRDGGEVKETLGVVANGRVAAEDIIDPATNDIIIRRCEVITDAYAKRIDEVGLEIIAVRSPLTCEVRRGICAKCYGKDLGTNNLVNVGEAIGVIAAQSIGEPGTQLTMRTFHFGGTVTHKVETSSLVSQFTGVAKFKNLKTVVNREGKKLSLIHISEPTRPY